MAQPLPMAYSTCALISSSVRSGRYENVPWVRRMSVVCSSLSDRRRRQRIGRVGGLVVEADLTPGVESGLERLAGLGSLLEDLGTLAQVLPALVAGLDHRLHGHPVGGGAGGDTHRIADRPPAELQHHILPQVVQQLVHLPSVDPSRGNGHHPWHRCPVLLEIDAMERILVYMVPTQDVVVALDQVGVTFQLANNCP